MLLVEQIAILPHHLIRIERAGVEASYQPFSEIRLRGLCISFIVAGDQNPSDRLFELPDISGPVIIFAEVAFKRGPDHGYDFIFRAAKHSADQVNFTYDRQK